jgi:2-oxoglutarate ferredoxin oxidoreductase subunit alpha
MGFDITIKIGGEAGQGIQTVGQLLASACREAGLYVFGINDFESRIRGGHSFYQLRIADQQVRAPHQCVKLLIAMDDVTLEQHCDELLPGGICLLNMEATEAKAHVRPIPFIKLAEEAGGEILANTVATSAALTLLGAPFAILDKVLRNQFSAKSTKILDDNLNAARLGRAAVQGITFNSGIEWPASDKHRMIMEGTAALSLGALAGDCRFAAFYPMSPATGVMINLAGWQDRFPLIVEQAEDEIAAANMIIGASFAGVRSLTATSGGGFCLMTEALGLAGITETPIVLINAQRPGPATGLATRTAQADLRFVIHAAQDEFPRFVFAPGSPEQAYEITARAFDLADSYQVPALILVDQYFNDSLYTLATAFIAPETVTQHTIDDTSQDNPTDYKRFALNDSGVSLRALPCTGEALVMACSDEHKPDGHSTENAGLRTAMVDKRKRKVLSMLADMRPPTVAHPAAKIKLICWGSTLGAVAEAVELLRAGGTDAGYAHFCDVWPFPGRAAESALAGSERLICVEQNSTAQFAGLLRQETGIAVTQTVLKYDGRPFYPVEIVNAVLKAGR